ncbi:hypothetical protein RhiirA1_33994 [Rhizophagus irregularis]|uniref:Uncharacterized protein n=1 Tax=Rhizophagus irregularis TaxID=588596 RepID=A0A2N0SA12_9GLOM|nr:hypothetical protein RhiirA1_33994 [Rhizophagus irregularis]
MPTTLSCLTFVSSKWTCRLRHISISCIALLSLYPSANNLVSSYFLATSIAPYSMSLTYVLNIPSILDPIFLRSSIFLRRVRILFRFFLADTASLDDSFL